MQQSYNVLFASSNIHKYEEAKKILSEFGINLEFFQTDLMEIQDDSLSEIALKKVLYAYDKCKKPVIVEDDGLFIDSLSGFPGPFSSYVFKTIGNNGILKLTGDNRSAVFVSIIIFRSATWCNIFESKVIGTISKNIQGKGWGYDPIFIPENQTKTYAELADKNKLSHRYQSLKKFARHYIGIIEGNPCSYCGNDMRTKEGRSKSCEPIVIIDGKKYTRDNSENNTPFDNTDIYPGKDVACGDCGVINGIHHMGCDVERCPKHHKKQFITCTCSIEFLGDFEISDDGEYRRLPRNKQE